MRQTGANQERAQIANRELVLRILQHKQICSRAELAKQSGLQQATITHIINDFLQWKVVDETGLLSGAKGRRSIGLCISDEKYRVIGFRLTRQYYTIGVFALNGRETAPRQVFQIGETAPQVIIDQACRTINELIRDDPGHSFLAVGVAVPGPYFQDNGEIAMISAFPGWKNIKIQQMMQAQISIPVIVDHDANAGALAESCLVAENDMYDTLVYISVGQGIGAGIVEHGEVYRGAQGIAGEIGHTCIDFRGELCDCGGRGCLTLYASTIAITKKMRLAFSDPNMTFPQVVQLIRNKNETALRIFHETMQYLGIGIINLIYTYNPGCIVIGDEMSAIGQMILDDLSAYVQQMNVPRLGNALRIQLAKVDSDSAYVGAAILASRYVFSDIERFCNSGIDA